MKIKILSALAMIILISSSFTPFAYAQVNSSPKVSNPNQVPETGGNGTLNLLRVIQNGPQTCQNDVWVDSFDWNEYKSLLSNTLNLIDAWGNKNLGQQEQNLNNVGAGTNNDVGSATKNYFIPGVNGQPAILYDVMKNKVVNPGDTCQLNNLFSTGRIAYSTRLVDQIRYCALNDTNCEGGEITAAKRQQIQADLNLLKILKDAPIPDNIRAAIASSDVIRSAFQEAGVNVDNPDNESLKNGIVLAIDALEKRLVSTPTSFVEAESSQLTLSNADFLDLLPKTRVDFFEFMRNQKTWDELIVLLNIASTVTGLGGGFKGLKDLISTKGWKNFLLGAKTGGLKTITEGLDESGKVWSGGTKLGKSADELEKAFGGVKKAEDLAAAQTRAGQFITELDSNIKNVDKAITDLGNIPVNTLPPSQVQSFAEDLQNLRTAKSQLENARLTIVQAGQTLAGQTTADIAGYVANVRRGINDVNTASDLMESTKPSLGQNWARLLSDYTTAGTKLEKASVIANAAASVLSSVFSRGFGGAAGRLLALFQTTNFIVAGAIWFNNDRLINPAYTLQEATFSIGKDPITGDNLKNLANSMSQQHYFEIDKTADLSRFQTYTVGIFDTFFELLGYDPGKSPIRGKLTNIQDLIFIYDQDALSLGLNTKATNLIASPFVRVGNLSYWSFLSRFPDSSVVYNFEHPLGYVTTKKTGLFLQLFNINIGGILGEGQTADGFNTPLTGLINFGRKGRDLLAVLSMASIAPAAGHIIGGTTAGVAGGALGLVLGLVGGKEVFIGPVYNTLTGKYGELVNIKDAYDNPSIYCPNVFGPDEKAWIIAGKTAVTLLSGASIFLGPLKATPLVLISFAVDIANMIVSYAESNFEQGIAEKLRECVDTSFSGVAYKEFPDQKEVVDIFNQVFQPIKAEAYNLLSSLSPEIGQQFDSLAKSMVQQTLNINGEATNNLVSTTGKEVYFVWFKDADIKWFQSPTCNIDMCQSDGKGGFKCNTQSGYYLLDQNGDPILNGIPQAMSLRMNMPQDYMSVVQNVVEIAKKDEPFMEIRSDGPKVISGSSCGNDNIAGLLGIKYLDQTAQESTIKDTLGKLDGIYTDQGTIWFDGTDVAVQFYDEVTCDNGDTHGAREIFRYPNAYLKFYRNSDGKIEIVNDNGVQCSFKLGQNGAVSFSNALLRSGVNQPAVGTRKAVDNSNVFHLFIYSLLSFDRSELQSISLTDLCKDDTGKFSGFNIIGDLTIAEDQQFKNLIQDICFTDVKGQNNESIQFRDGKVCITDINQQTQCYDIQGFNDTTNRVNLGNGLELGVGVGSNGVPEWWLYQNGQRVGNPIPMLWMNGLGGSMMFNPNTGTISINNEFPFAINPSFGVYGGGGWIDNTHAAAMGRHSDSHRRSS